MIDLKNCKGSEFTAKILDVNVTGKIQVYGNEVYLCQDFFDGNECDDMLGYECSWFVGDGSESELIKSAVKDLIVIV